MESLVQGSEFARRRARRPPASTQWLTSPWRLSQPPPRAMWARRREPARTSVAIITRPSTLPAGCGTPSACRRLTDDPSLSSVSAPPRRLARAAAARLANSASLSIAWGPGGRIMEGRARCCHGSPPTRGSHSQVSAPLQSSNWRPACYQNHPRPKPQCRVCRGRDKPTQLAHDDAARHRRPSWPLTLAARPWTVLSMRRAIYRL